MNRIKCILLVVLLNCVAMLQGQTLQETLSAGWKLKVGEGRLIDAEVPGYVHTDLLRAGIIKDPFYGANEQDASWVAEKEWHYTLTFNTGLHGSKRVELLFEGLDTYAEVFLNGTRILVANNQFVPWRSNVSGLLKESGNKLLVVFKPYNQIEDSLQKAYGLSLPGGSRVFTRKGQWQYGWDWAPALPSMGIWKGVSLDAYDKLALRDVSFRQSFNDHKLSGLEAIFCVEVFEATRAGFAVNHPSLDSITRFLSLEPGFHEVSIPLFLNGDVKYWWPAGMGDQHLYEFECVVKGVDPDPPVRKVVRTGIREVELVREPDLFGESFYFRINGLPVFAKGANWVPLDHFPARATPERYRKMMDEVIFANMNMLRVWGGGIYEDDLFYTLCDEKGIMVWQDFMFACAMYPGDEAMLANIRSEAEHQVVRLRNHPSLVLWCGNNEVSEGWHRWGWPSDYSEADSARIRGDYLKIFEELLPEVVAKEAPGAHYWPSSPSLGRGDPGHVYRGDAHYWGVWHDAEPFEMFRRKVPRFMSEFGFQSYPMAGSVRKFAPEDAMKPDSEIMLVHQKHPRGNQLIGQYMKEWFPEPENFEQYLYYSQLMQSEGMAIGILAHREAKPWCMGTLYWQLNDCWPAVSWSSIDYYGDRKAIHYKIKDVFAPIISTVKITGDRYDITIINDNAQVDEVNLFFEIIDHQGKGVYSVYYPNAVASYKTNRQRTDKIPAEVAAAYHENKLICRLKTMTTDYTYFIDQITLPDKPKNIPFRTPEIRQKIEKKGDEFMVTFWADAFVYGLYLEAEEADGVFSNNFINIIPGELKTVMFTPDNKIDSLNVRYMYYKNQ